MLIGDDACEPFCVEPADDIRGLNAAIDCDTPSANMNCSRSSMFVRPLASFGLGVFFIDFDGVGWLLLFFFGFEVPMVVIVMYSIRVWVIENC